MSCLPTWLDGDIDTVLFRDRGEQRLDRVNLYATHKELDRYHGIIRDASNTFNVAR